jgi:hypothetical protein
MCNESCCSFSKKIKCATKSVALFQKNFKVQQRIAVKMDGVSRPKISLHFVVTNP